MRFKGKVDLWFWLVMFLGDALIIMALMDGGFRSIIMIATALLYNVIFLPLVVNNYVEVTDDKLTVAMGFWKSSVALSEIKEVYQTNNPISSSAASLDRIVIQAENTQMMCAVKEKEVFFDYLQEKNPDIVIHKGKKGGKGEKFALLLTSLVCVIIGIILFTGNIKMEYEEDSFTIKASYWSDAAIEYDEIESIEYRDEEIPGSRTGGFGSFRLLMGNFENEEFGYYTRYTYTNSDSGVVLVIKGRETVLSGKDKESTYQIYEELLARCGM